jgi:hypothetical protein
MAGTSPAMTVDGRLGISVYNRVDKENTNPTGRQEIVRFSENIIKN